MVLKSLIVKTKCDNGLCKNFADYAVDREGTPMNMRLNICLPCIAELNTHFSKLTKPKKQK